MTSTRTVYIVDDNAEFRESAAFWLSGAGYEVQDYGDPEEALEGLCRHAGGAPACVLLDVRMPRLSGLDLHDALRQRGNRLPVIYMSGHADVPLAVNAMRKGAISVLEKPLDDAALEAALDNAFAEPVVASTTTAAIDERSAHPLPSPVDDEAAAEFRRREALLAPREREVLGMVIEGVYNKNIADRIGLSIKTVELYRARGMQKLKVKSVAELTRMMISQRV